MNDPKRYIIEQLVGRVQEGVDQLASAAASSRHDAIEAEGRMQTRYGSAKEEHGYLADGLNMRVQQRAGEVARLRSLSIPENNFIVQQGSLVRLEDVEGKRFVDYILLPCCGGEQVQVDGNDVMVVTPESPMGSAMLGLDIGEPFSVALGNGTKNYRVANVA
jgi:transcription elongation GreA/GreB family factor